MNSVRHQSYGKWRSRSDTGPSVRGTPGRGQVDFVATRKALERIGYDGWLVVECFSRRDPEFGNGLRIWRELDGGAEEVLAAGAALLRD